MEVSIYYSDDFLLHTDPDGLHPENPNRLRLVIDGVKELERGSRAVKLVKRDYLEATLKLLAKVHQSNYIEYIRLESSKGPHYIDSDTYVNEYTFSVASKAFAASYMGAKEAIVSNKHVVVLTRPPGHHAGISGRAMGAPSLGFCIFNNCAAAVISAFEAGIKRVLVLDFDAHHGNGTQEILWYNPNVVHLDIHEFGIYPGTGDVKHLGGGEAKGTKINIPVPPFSDDSVYAWVLDAVLKPVAEDFKPELIVVSAGFDGHEKDPLTHLELSDLTYSMIGCVVSELIRRGPAKTSITVLEGGYSEGLKSGFKVFVKSLVKCQINHDTLSRLSSDCMKRYGILVSEVISTLSEFWRVRK